MMDRRQMIAAMSEPTETWDVIVIGGGATGLSAALDAAARGHRTVLVEAGDFASGTSSRSTKLIHGGVRYLRQGRIRMVQQSLAERGYLLQNAPHLVHPVHFVLPAYQRLEQWYYLAGLKLYDFLAGQSEFEPARRLSVSETLSCLPTIRSDGLRGGIEFSDGQFDDSRLAVSLAMTAADYGAVLANYVPVIRLIHERSRLKGVVVRDLHTGQEISLRGKVVLNATGVFADSVLQMDDDPTHARSQPKDGIVVASQGSHLVLDPVVLPGRHAMMIPHTDDGRVLFAIPWHDRVLFGTTDLAVPEVTRDPQPMNREIDYLLEHASRYFRRPVTREHVRGMYAGLRPLVRPAGSNRSTAGMSREHEILVSDSGMITVIGGKWTTCRAMGEELIDRAENIGELPKQASSTRTLKLSGHPDYRPPRGAQNVSSHSPQSSFPEGFPETAPLHPRLNSTYRDVRIAVQQEMAQTTEDVLARRTRSLLLDAQAASECCEQVTGWIGRLLEKDSEWCHQQVREFRELCSSSIPSVSDS
ncbi:MAG: FAD-dependent oxidoreductase [Planctomyces sp.]